MPDLAMSLNNLSAFLSEVACGEACGCSAAVDAYQVLAEASLQVYMCLTWRCR